MGPGVPARPMSLAFDVFWSFRSPYSYLATPRLVRLASEYVAEVSRAIWGGDVDGWHRGSHLADAAARAGLDLAALDVAIAEAPGRYDAVVAENQRALEAAGHWGVPTMVFAGEPFFGQARID